jgi:electron transport complex protein RnfB
MLAEFLIAAALMGGIGVILAVVLAIADKKFYVWEDPRIDEVEAMLPLANCGACGCPGCRAFAEKAVNGEIAPGKCTVNSPAGIVKIAQYLKVDAGTQEKRVARLACAGGRHVARQKANYEGLESCRAAALVSVAARAAAGDVSGLPTARASANFRRSGWMPTGCPLLPRANAQRAAIALKYVPKACSHCIR